MAGGWHRRGGVDRRRNSRLAAGAGLGLGVIEIRGDPFVETALTTVLAFASYLIAELMFDASGVAATLAAGITLGTWGRTKIYVAVESYLDKFWDFAAAATAATVLLLVGLAVNLGAVSEYWDVILVAIITMVLARAAAVFVLMPAVAL